MKTVASYPALRPQLAMPSTMDFNCNNYMLYRYLAIMAPPKIDFEIHKDRLYNLYIVERCLMDDVRQYMKTIYNFDARYIILLLLYIYN